MGDYCYYSFQQLEGHNPTAHILTNDFDEAQDEAELDHLDHPERAHGVIDTQTREVVYRLEAE